MADNPDRNYIVLKPAYSGRRLPSRDIGATDRIVTVLGSFLWIPKKANLEAFLSEAAHVFPDNSIRVRVVGMMDKAYQQKLQAAYPWAEIVGPVENTDDELTLARIGVVPELSGGGFKHKTLFYVFNRVAVAGIVEALAGSTLEPDAHYIAARDIPTLVRRISDAIDDIPKLSTMIDRAFAHCDDKFNWPDRGTALLDAIRSRSTPAAICPGRPPHCGN
jgi:polysaccharide biosynthesis protein PslH